MRVQNPAQLLFEAAESDDIRAIRYLLTDRPDLVHTRNDDLDTALIVAARSGKLSAVEVLLDAGSDPNALGQHLDAAVSGAAANCWVRTVERLVAVTNPTIARRAASWAFNSTCRGREETLELLRNQPSLAAEWKRAGLPVERRDNFTMTQMCVLNTCGDGVHNAVASAGRLIGAEGVDNEREQLTGKLAVREIQVQRRGADFTTYQFAGTLESNIYATDARFECSAGFAVEGSRMQSHPGVVIEPVQTKTYATSRFRGAYGQIGYAHSCLRQMIAREGLHDVCRELRETYNYWEGRDSDYNQITLAIEVSDTQVTDIPHSA